jgi:hypothetical protein
VIIRFASDGHPTPTRLWWVDDRAFVIAAGDTAALVVADRELTAETCDELSTVLYETARFLKGHAP